MRLKNKKTGERGIINHFDNQSIVIYPIDENWNAKGDKKYVYASLADLNADWEDYEEPKKYYVINPVDWVEVIGEIEYRNDSTDKVNKKIGNYFETKEEAELAVEKLKAFKRLKDKGFRFVEWQKHGITEDFVMDGAVYFEDVKNADRKDLDLLFGGKE